MNITYRKSYILVLAISNPTNAIRVIEQDRSRRQRAERRSDITNDYDFDDEIIPYTYRMLERAADYRLHRVVVNLRVILLKGYEYG